MYLFLSFLVSVLVLSLQETIKVTVFYESLCPGSQDFFKKQLYPAYQKLGKKALALELFPYSEVQKTNGSDDWYVYCQHGDEECFANKVQACALGLNNTLANSIRFVGCIMSTNQPQKKTKMRRCAKKSDVSWPDIRTCFNSDQGIQLMSKIYNTTMGLKPTLKYVPHIIINDKFNRTVEKFLRHNFLKTICDMYGDEKPISCL